MQYAVRMQYAVGIRAKRSNPTQWTWHIWVVGTVTFSEKKVKPHAVSTQYAVGTQCKKVKPHAVGMQYTVGMQYAVGVSTKRSIHTVDLANMGGGECYL